MASGKIATTLQLNSTGSFSVFDPRGVQQTVAAATPGAGAGGGAAAAASAESDPLFSLDPAVRGAPWKVSELSLDDRYAVCRSVGEECIQDAELRALLDAKPHPVCYDGFEPSGRVHIAQGVLRTINVNKLTKAGCIFKFWVADWFALLNNKMGGDLDKIRTVGKYMVEVWKSAGMDMQNVAFLWASDSINGSADEYWRLVMDVARKFNLARIQRCCTIMGRKESDDMSAAQIMYPCMQCTDVFFLKADICQLGMDQRKVNMLAREYAGAKKKRFKPVIISHHMLSGLKEGQEKMSKSEPDSAIFMEDTEADVKRKIKKAFCPPEVVEGNPILDYANNIILGYYGTISVNLMEQGAGAKTYTDFAELCADYSSGKIHPGDLKAAVTEALNRILEPVRAHFAQGEPKILLDKIKKFKITR
jgi:tyrosyl-tRNA synthetase